MDTLDVAKNILLNSDFTYYDLCQLCKVSKSFNNIWSSDEIWSLLNDFVDLDKDNIKEQYKKCLESCFYFTEAKRNELLSLISIIDQFKEVDKKYMDIFEKMSLNCRLLEFTAINSKFTIRWFNKEHFSYSIEFGQ